MKKFVTLLLCMLPVSLFAQVNDGKIGRAHV